MAEKELQKGLVVFQDKKIRRLWHNNEWFFSVVDIIAALTDSLNANDYWYRLKKREYEYSGIELSTFCRQLKLPSADGKYYDTDCANTESIFRINLYQEENKSLQQLFSASLQCSARPASQLFHVFQL